jgi:hypothetical protein
MNLLRLHRGGWLTLPVGPHGDGNWVLEHTIRREGRSTQWKEEGIGKAT